MDDSGGTQNSQAGVQNALYPIREKDKFLRFASQRRNTNVFFWRYLKLLADILFKVFFLWDSPKTCSRDSPNLA